MYQQAAMLALGFCNADSMSLLLEEMQILVEDYSTTRTSVSAQALEVNSLGVAAMFILLIFRKLLAKLPSALHIM